MVVNPFFLHGSTSEQNLMQDLINEQIRMYGMDVYYIPREFVKEATIMREITSSAFNSYFVIEAYLNNVDGYGGQGDIMSKFGIQVKDEVTLVISRERYENYIAPFLNSRMQYLLDSRKLENTLQTIHRPKEGDLIYFPLGRRIFEIKFVEHEQPFYQLGKGYTYELQCELFEYEDEVLNTTIDEIDSSISDKGYITSLELIPISNRAEVSVELATGYITELVILNEGNNYTVAPDIIIDPPAVGEDPNVVSLLTIPNKNLDTSAIKQLVVFRSGSGYTEAPNVTVDGDGRGGEIRALINEDPNSMGVFSFVVDKQGAGYPEDANIIAYDLTNRVIAKGKALSDGSKIVSTIVTDPGKDIDPDNLKVIVEAPVGAGEGDYTYNEIVVGKSSGTRARVRGWSGVDFILQITNLDPSDKDVFFTPGEVVVGETSGAKYSLKNWNKDTPSDKFAQNDEIQDVADEIVDTTEYNQFVKAPAPFAEDFFTDDNPFGE